MTEQMAETAPEEAGAGGDDVPEYRISHLQDDLADTFSERDAVGLIAPFRKGGVKPRVHNRVTFTLSDPDRREWTERVLDLDGYAWTVGDESGKYVVLGRAIRDVGELRDGDRIHLNKRGGPFKVFRVLEQESGPEVLQKCEPSVTVELTNVDTGTDWMVVHWDGEPEPWAYVRTKDQNAKGGFRYRKVERVEWWGRIGPARLFAPPVDMTEGVETRLPEVVAAAAEATGTGIHPSDLKRVETLTQKPIPDLFTPEDADRIRTFLMDMSEWYEREANALEVETQNDKNRAAVNQNAAKQCRELAGAFTLTDMDAVDDADGSGFYHHAACGVGFTDRFKYSKHCGLCEADEPDADVNEGGN